MVPEEDVDIWVEGLAGRSGGRAGRTTDALRDVIQARGNRADQQCLGDLVSSDAMAELALQRLRFRLKREGLADNGLLFRPYLWVPAAAAVLLAVVIGVDSVRSPSSDGGWDTVYDEAPRLRGGAGVEIRDTTPEATAKNLAAALVKIGVRSTLYLHAGTAALVFELDSEQLDAARTLLRERTPRVGLSVGTNRVLLRPD